jgi:hypothetical protein
MLPRMALLAALLVVLASCTKVGTLWWGTPHELRWEGHPSPRECRMAAMTFRLMGKDETAEKLGACFWRKQAHE